MNLFDKTNGEYLPVLVNANTHVITSDGVARSFCVPCKPNTTYILSGMTAGSTWGSFPDKKVGTVANRRVAKKRARERLIGTLQEAL